MSVLIKDMEIPKSCSECKLDLRTDICKAFCEWNAEHPYSIRATDRLPDCPLSVVPELCEDTVPRTSVEYICQKNTVSTNPYKHEYHEKFIKFMNDPEIADFGRWQHSNGFNTALVAVKCDLDKVPPVTQKQSTGKCKWCEGLKERNLRIEYYWIDEEGCTASFSAPHIVATGIARYCPNCGARMNQSNKTCDCYSDGRCLGTKEIDPCSCSGNKSKCDFYEHVRQEGARHERSD